MAGQGAGHPQPGRGPAVRGSGGREFPSAEPGGLLEQRHLGGLREHFLGNRCGRSDFHGLYQRARDQRAAPEPGGLRRHARSLPHRCLPAGIAAGHVPGRRRCAQRPAALLAVPRHQSHQHGQDRVFAGRRVELGAGRHRPAGGFGALQLVHGGRADTGGAVADHPGGEHQHLGRHGDQLHPAPAAHHVLRERRQPDRRCLHHGHRAALEPRIFIQQPPAFHPGRAGKVSAAGR